MDVRKIQRFYNPCARERTLYEYRKARIDRADKEPSHVRKRVLQEAGPPYVNDCSHTSNTALTKLVRLSSLKGYYTFAKRDTLIMYGDHLKCSGDELEAASHRRFRRSTAAILRLRAPAKISSRSE